jgi:hypothetical protein
MRFRSLLRHRKWNSVRATLHRASFTGQFIDCVVSLADSMTPYRSTSPKFQYTDYAESERVSAGMRAHIEFSVRQQTRSYASSTGKGLQNLMGRFTISMYQRG